MTTLMIDPDDGETDFYVMDGKPIALWPDWDYAEFRAFVKARHALS